MNPFDKLKDAAKKHELYKTNDNIIIGKGDKDSPDILFISEFPGHRENEINVWCKKNNIEMQKVTQL